jgi:hypothetical protein
MSQHRRPPAPAAGQVVTVEPGRYPVFSSATAMRLTHALQDEDVSQKAQQAIARSAAAMRTVVLDYIRRVEAAAREDDYTRIYEEAHEIRGLAGNAGLVTTQLAANSLCRYLDALAVAAHTPERIVIRLHLEAIARTAHAEDEATQLGDTVVNQLALLVEKKLDEINAQETDAGSTPV